MIQMHRLTIPHNYRSFLDLRGTEKAIKFIKDLFQVNLAQSLNLMRVSAPLIVLNRGGVNDYLSGKEIPVQFDIDDLQEKGEIVQSLAKWKRKALAEYRFNFGEGLYTDMNAIRPHEFLDNLHSIYVDQWDWEKVISPEERSLAFLKQTVQQIYRVVFEKEREVCRQYPLLSKPILPEDIFFIHSEELEAMYPSLSPKERETAICRKKGAVFIIGIGAALKNGKPHEERASDYDDWITENGAGYRGFNGDILVWYPLLECAFELSSMGIRVNDHSLVQQLEIKAESYKVQWDYHQRLIRKEFPQTIGGGIGQSRLCMFYLRKAHIGEVQASIWPDSMIQECRKHHIPLL